ncbi:MAG: LytTR family DNA-binding domain-containing protein [Syntrophaceticus sp.]|nr:LytTR family DNA-binding domain-containing protein [Syntrophaceticus sp.]MDD3314500.1 LytTR family DNA-binding domain-containing protein [Syntrophaceticus sp.]MDD4360137.1 LytTR family DNA-binding domain-containing protein [Syntrophaceticus sp.]
MRSLKVAAADDERGVLLLLKSILSEMDGIQLAGVSENAADAIELVESQKPDLALLDIELPDMKGIELAEKLRQIKPDLYIVFITAYENYSLDAFRLYAYDYILKPIDQRRVKDTVTRIRQAMQVSNKAHGDSPSRLQNTRIAINQRNEKIFVSPDDIYYLEKQGPYIQIHTKNQKIKTRETLKNFEERLQTGFFRSHKSYLVNISQIERVVNCSRSSYYEVYFKNYDEQALLSRERINELMEQFA